MPDHHPEHPRARQDDVLSERLGDELLVFDTTTSRAHSLNAAAAAVFKACDGTRDAQQISEHCQLDPLAVTLALDTLADAKLLHDYTPATERVSRRTAIRRLALTGAGIGVALPVIRSIVAPTAAMAGSTAGSSCGSQADCTGASSFCHSDGQCHPSTCLNVGSARPGPCSGSHPCCYPLNSCRSFSISSSSSSGSASHFCTLVR